MVNATPPAAHSRRPCRRPHRRAGPGRGPDHGEPGPLYQLGQPAPDRLGGRPLHGVPGHQGGDDRLVAQARRQAAGDPHRGDELGRVAGRLALQPAGQHDFDWEIGTWKTHLKRLKGPLTGSTTWVEYEGTTVVPPRARAALDACDNIVISFDSEA